MLLPSQDIFNIILLIFRVLLIVDNVELDAMYNQYLSLSTLDQEGGGITRLTFEQALGPLGLEKNLITERIFRFFDQDENGTISFKEMACGLSVLCKGNFDEKIDCKSVFLCADTFDGIGLF